MKEWFDMNEHIVQRDGYKMIYIETEQEFGPIIYLDHICLQDDYKLFAINADYRPQNKSNSWYYVVAKNSKAAREKFKTRITWLNVYAVKEVLDHAEMNSVILQPLNHIIL